MRVPGGSRRQKLSWVSKGDVTGFVRCPYAWWLIDTGQISAEEAFSPLQAELAEAGIEFEAGVVAGAQPITIPPGREKEVLQGDLTLFSNRLFRNDALRLHGRPDGMVSASGAVEPIEIKSHRRVRHMDLLELAFYWGLLAPLRSLDAEPAGWVFLRAPDDSVTRERVTINRQLFSELDDLIAAVRQARAIGVEPTVYCRCAVCGGLRRDTVLRTAIGAKDVSTIWGVGRTYRTALSAAGVSTWDQLIASDAEKLAAQVRASDPRRCAGVTPPLVRRWQAHAKAFESGEPVWVDTRDQFPVGVRYVALDLEYISDTMEIWLIGARVVDPAGHVTFSCWSDPAGNREAFAAFAELLQRFEALPVITYNGLSADLPALRAATSRCDSERILELIDTRHVDVYDWLSSRLMLPVLDFGLKDISHHAGITRQADVTSGLQATQMYRQYRRTGDPALRDRLLDYNRDDIDGLVQGIEYLRRLIAPSDAGAYQLIPASEVIDLAFELPIRPAAAPPVVRRPAQTDTTREEVLIHARERVPEVRRLGLSARARQDATTTVQPPSSKPPATAASPSPAKPRWTCPYLRS